MKRNTAVLILLSAAIVACSGSQLPGSGIILGTLTTGLGEGKWLSVRDTLAQETITITANGNYQFPRSYGSSYGVIIVTQPVGQTCTLANASGPLILSNTPPVRITCANSAITIGGTISGLAAGEQAELRNNGSDSLVVRANGAFTFPTPVASGTNYYVTVLSPERCTKSNEYGVATAPVTTVRIIC
jgi:hypothetical protein